MDSARSNDSEVVERYLRGDPEAVATVDAWILRAARSFRKRLEAHWDDVLQEIRLEVFRLLQQGRFRGESRLSTYLWPVVAHTCLDRIRVNVAVADLHPHELVVRGTGQTPGEVEVGPP